MTSDRTAAKIKRVGEYRNSKYLTYNYHSMDAYLFIHRKTFYFPT